MHGELYQECEHSGCSTEPVCAACFKCARHCNCDAEAMYLNKARAENQSAFDKMLHGMDEIVAIPAGAQLVQVGEKLDFSPFGGGVYKTYTPVLYTAPAELAGRYGVHYWYYIGGDESTQTDDYWVATPEESPARKAAADAWLAAKVVKDAAAKALQQEQNARWEKDRAATAAKKVAADAALAAVVAKLSALVPRLATMTKAAILAETGDLLNSHVIMQSWAKAKLVEAITAHVARGCVVPRKHERYEYDQIGPDY